MTRIHSALALAAATLLASTGACYLEELTVDHVVQESGCPMDLCGLNSNLGKGFSISYLGDVNHAGFAVINAYSFKGRDITITVHNNELMAWHVDDGTELVGMDLLDAYWTMSHTSGNKMYLYIEDIHLQEVESWAFPNEQYTTYEFAWRWSADASNVRNPLCGDLPWDDDGSGDPSLNEAVVSPREAYDWQGDPSNDLANDPYDGDGWATIGCAGGAFAKKLLMGYDMDFIGARNSTRGENATTINMVMARYCGGTHHTEAGTPFAYNNDRDWFGTPTSGDIEAMWDENGAVCLNTPRFVDPADVAAECDLPRCDNFIPGKFTWTSYLP